MRALRRALPLWLALLAAYGLGLALDGGERSAQEARVLLTAESIVSDRDIDVRDEYRRRDWREFYDGRSLETSAQPTGGRLHEPHGVAFPLLVAPAYLLGGALAVELLCAALLALAFCLSAALASRLVPEPWATRAVLVAGLSPPALDAGSSISPDVPAAAALAGAVLLALRVREAPRLPRTFWSAMLAGALPWLAPKLLLPGAVVALALARWLRRRQRGLAGFVALEVFLTSAVVFVTVTERLFEGLLPQDAARPGGAPYDWTALGLDLAVVPVVWLAAVGLWRVWHGWRGRLSVAVPGHVDVEVAGAFLGVTALAALASTAVPQPWMRDGHEALVAIPLLAALAGLGWQRAPRAGGALAAVTVGLAVVSLAS